MPGRRPGFASDANAPLAGGDGAGSAAGGVEPSGAGGSASPLGWAAGVGAADLLALTKPRITGLVSLVAGAAFLASGRALDLVVLAALLAGTALLAGGTNGLNQVLEREEDGRMDRTRGRPLPAGRLEAGRAVVFALALVAAGGAILLAAVNPLTAGLGLASSVLYVAVYTPMKQASALALPVGAVPGALPALGGWTAATGRVDAAGLALFGILFLWQIPHFLALGWVHREDYRRAGFAVAAARDAADARSGEMAVLSGLALLPVSLLPVLLGRAGWAYALVALAAGLVYLARSARMNAGLGGLAGADASGGSPGAPAGRAGRGEGEAGAADRRAGELFRASLLYLPVVLVALAVDVRLLESATLAAEHLPTVNASLNAGAAAALVAGVALVRRGRVRAHRSAMLLAAGASAVFLASYVVHHLHAGSVPFGGDGWLRWIYLGVLATHAVLAVTVVPLVVVALSRALRGRRDAHRRIVRWTAPVWLYVSVTGVVVFYMVYVM